MKHVIFFIFMFPVYLYAQNFIYKPKKTVDITVGKTYYNTEYIYIQNLGEKSVTAQFELVKNTFPTEWSQTACTNTQCYTDIPNYGTVGTLKAGGEGFFSINVSTNNFIGAGELIFSLTATDDPTLNDTLKFRYAATEDGKVTPQPWANVVFKNGILTILLQDPYLKTNVLVSTLDGKPIYNQPLNPITSFPLYNDSKGIYILIIEDEKGRIIKQRIPNI